MRKVGVPCIDSDLHLGFPCYVTVQSNASVWRVCYVMYGRPAAVMSTFTSMSQQPDHYIRSQEAPVLSSHVIA